MVSFDSLVFENRGKLEQIHVRQSRIFQCVCVCLSLVLAMIIIASFMNCLIHKPSWTTTHSGTHFINDLCFDGIYIFVVQYKTLVVVYSLTLHFFIVVCAEAQQIQGYHLYCNVHCSLFSCMKYVCSSNAVGEMIDVEI